MADKVDFLGDEEALSLPYFKCHRMVAEAFVEHDVSAVAQRLFLYMCHNCLIHQGISFRLPVSEMAEWVRKSERTVYRAIAELEETGLIKVRHHGDIVVSLPSIVLAQIEAKALAVDKTVKEREDALEGRIRAMVAIMEETLKRTLTMRERENVTRSITREVLGK